MTTVTTDRISNPRHGCQEMTAQPDQARGFKVGGYENAIAPAKSTVKFHR